MDINYMLNQDEHKEYCRCWWVYLDKIVGDKEFAYRVRRELTWIDSVKKWPMNWPEVSYMFTSVKEYDYKTATREFVRIIQLAETPAEGR